MLTTIKQYQDGAKVYDFDGTQFTVNRYGNVTHMTDWTRCDEFKTRGIFTSRTYHTGCYMGYATDFSLA